MSRRRPSTVVRFDRSAPGGDWERCGPLEYATLFIGGELDPASPAAVVIRADRDAGDRIAGRRTHASSCMTVVIEGAVQLDGRWLGPGEIQIAPAGAAHGDLVIGADGAVLLLLFAQRSGLVPTFDEPGDQQRFDETLRAVVEDVASGRAERVTPLLPPRPAFTPRRNVVVTAPSELAALKSTRQPGS